MDFNITPRAAPSNVLTVSWRSVNKREWIKKGKKTYPNKTKTYGPSTTCGIVKVTPRPQKAT